MRTIAVLTGVLGLAFPNIAAGHFLHHHKNLTVSEKVVYFERSIRHDRAQVARDQRFLRRLVDVRYQQITGARPLYGLISHRARFHRIAFRWHRHLLAHYRRVLSRSLSPQSAIAQVFGPYANEALRVSYCETGGTYSTSASNGQYLGLFQMGDYARSRYGHSSTALGQARAAYAYFVDSGRDWSPWECRP